MPNEGGGDPRNQSANPKPHENTGLVLAPDPVTDRRFLPWRQKRLELFGELIDALEGVQQSLHRMRPVFAIFSRTGSLPEIIEPSAQSELARLGIALVGLSVALNSVERNVRGRNAFTEVVRRLCRAKSSKSLLNASEVKAMRLARAVNNALFVAKRAPKGWRPSQPGESPFFNPCSPGFHRAQQLWRTLNRFLEFRDLEQLRTEVGLTREENTQVPNTARGDPLRSVEPYVTIESTGRDSVWIREIQGSSQSKPVRVRGKTKIAMLIEVARDAGRDVSFRELCQVFRRKHISLANRASLARESRLLRRALRSFARYWNHDGVGARWDGPRVEVRA